MSSASSTVTEDGLWDPVFRFPFRFWSRVSAVETGSVASEWSSGRVSSYSSIKPFEIRKSVLHEGLKRETEQKARVKRNRNYHVTSSPREAQLQKKWQAGQWRLSVVSSSTDRWRTMFMAIVVPGLTFKGHRTALMGSWSFSETPVRLYRPSST